MPSSSLSCLPVRTNYRTSISTFSVKVKISHQTAKQSGYRHQFEGVNPSFVWNVNVACYGM